MEMDPYSSVVVDIIWNVFEQMLMDRIADYIPEWVIPVGAETEDVSLSVTPCNDQNMMHERMISNGSARSDMSAYHSLHSSDEPQGQYTMRERVLSNGSTRSYLSAYHSLHSNDEPQRRSLSQDSLGSEDSKSSSSDVMSKPGTLVSTESGTKDNSSNSDMMLKPGTLVSTESGPKDNSTTSDMSKPGTLVSSESGPEDNSSNSDMMSKPGILASTEGVFLDNLKNSRRRRPASYPLCGFGISPQPIYESRNEKALLGNQLQRTASLPLFKVSGRTIRRFS